MFQYKGTEQVANLSYVDIGQFTTLVVTGATGATSFDIEFQHAGDSTWHPLPGHVGVTLSGGVAAERFKMISGRMRISFDASPGTWIGSLIHDAVPNF